MKAVIIEDDREVIEAIQMCFELRWPEVEVFTADAGHAGVNLVQAKSPDFVLLDLGLPDIDGFEVCQRIRRFSDLPILMLTARDAENYKVLGLDLGADDYITKPFNHAELIARIKSVIRRTVVPEAPKNMKPFTMGRITVDLAERKVTVDGDIVDLTPTEYHLLYRLATNAGESIRSEVLLEMIWGPEHSANNEYLKIYVERLRDKLKDSSESPNIITSEGNSKYSLTDNNWRLNDASG